MKRTKKHQEMEHDIVWKPTASEFKCYDATAVHAELTKLGHPSPEQLITLTKDDPSLILHKIIHGPSQAEAAHIGRLEIARRLVRSVQVIIKQPNNVTIRVRAFTSLHRPSHEEPHRRVYVSTVEQMQTEEGRALILRQAWIELRTIRRKYAALAELAKVHDAIDAVFRAHGLASASNE